jgi:hypothetical protein
MTLLASENMLRVERAVTREPCGVKPLQKHADGRPARHSLRRASLYSGCDSARQRAGKCRVGRGGLICHADHTSGRFALGQEPSRSSGTKLGGGMAFHFFTRSDRRLPGPGKAGATWGGDCSP